MLVNIPIDVLYNLQNSAKFHPRNAWNRIFRDSRLENNYLDYPHLRCSLCPLKNKALVTALQFIPIDCPDLLPLDYAVVNVKTYRDSARQMLNIFLAPPKKQRK